MITKLHTSTPQAYKGTLQRKIVKIVDNKYAYCIINNTIGESIEFGTCERGDLPHNVAKLADEQEDSLFYSVEWPL